LWLLLRIRDHFGFRFIIFKTVTAEQSMLKWYMKRIVDVLSFHKGKKD